MKLRIISGKYGGRIIEAPSGHKTHPMSEKIRGAVFNMLGNIEGLTFLDAYGGSGAVALEAASRGAKDVITVESDKHAFNTIQLNIKSLAAQGIRASRANIRSWLDNNPDRRFDIILCDPPYDDVKDEVLIYIATFLEQNGTIIYSLPPTNDISVDERFYERVVEKSYGDAKILVYKTKG